MTLNYKILIINEVVDIHHLTLHHLTLHHLTLHHLTPPPHSSSSLLLLTPPPQKSGLNGLYITTNNSDVCHRCIYLLKSTYIARYVRDWHFAGSKQQNSALIWLVNLLSEFEFIIRAARLFIGSDCGLFLPLLRACLAGYISSMHSLYTAINF